MSYVNNFAHFNYAYSDADRLHWGQALLKDALVLGLETSSLQAYLTDLRQVDFSYEQVEQAASVKEDADWLFFRSWDFIDSKAFTLRYPLWAARKLDVEPDAFATQDDYDRYYSRKDYSRKDYARLSKSVVKNDRERTIAIKRRARRAAEYA